MKRGNPNGYHNRIALRVKTSSNDLRRIFSAPRGSCDLGTRARQTAPRVNFPVMRQLLWRGFSNRNLLTRHVFLATAPIPLALCLGTWRKNTKIKSDETEVAPRIFSFLASRPSFARSARRVKQTSKLDLKLFSFKERTVKGRSRV